MLEVRYAANNRDFASYGTERIREDFHIGGLFQEGEIKLVYSHFDRIIAGSVCPKSEGLKLEASKELGVEFFLERRELGIINIGESGFVILDGQEYELKNRDGMYVGMGTRDVVFKSKDPNKPAKFYINSAPAHKTYPTVKIAMGDIIPLEAGSSKEINKRKIHQFIHPNVCESCQLQMGLTMFEEGSVWNTMPAHTHDRRMEVYFYFDMDKDTMVFHLMGEPDETRHIVVRNEEAVISPSWSIHSGVATGNYTFIWGMCGENINYTDMDHIDSKDLR